MTEPILYNRCKVCNRPLKSYENRLRGYGDKCAKKVEMLTNCKYQINFVSL